jgi:hypothetical protein
VDGDAGPAGLGLLVEDLVVDLVNCGEVGYVRQEDVDLDAVVDAASGALEDGGQVDKRLALGGGTDQLTRTLKDSRRYFL